MVPERIAKSPFSYAAVAISGVGCHNWPLCGPAKHIAGLQKQRGPIWTDLVAITSPYGARVLDDPRLDVKVLIAAFTTIGQVV